MRKGWLLFLTSLLLTSAALAHRLNEYLEATTISLSRDEIVLELRLTPGVAVAAQVLKGIDKDNNGFISEVEQLAYLATLSHDISLMLDERYISVRSVSSIFPTVEAMKKGTGDIIIDYETGISQKGPLHHLQLVNKHYPSIAVYLVNCLLPADTNIRVTRQKRSVDQSVYELDFTTNSAGGEERQSLEKRIIRRW